MIQLFFLLILPLLLACSDMQQAPDKLSKPRNNKVYCNFDFIQMEPFCECETGFEFSKTDTTMTFLVREKTVVFKLDKALGAYHYQYEYKTNHPQEEDHYLYDVYLKSGVILKTVRSLIEGDTVYYDLYAYYLDLNKEFRTSLKIKNNSNDIKEVLKGSAFLYANINTSDIWENTDCIMDLINNRIIFNHSSKTYEFTQEKKVVEEMPIGACITKEADLAYRYFFLDWILG